MKKIIIAGIIFFAAFFCWSCTKQITSYVPQPTPFAYPSTYTFSNVNYTNQRAILATIDTLMATIDQGNTQNTVVDSVALRNIFNGTTTGVNLSSLCVDSAAIVIPGYFIGIAADSHSTVAGSDGVPGVGASTQNTSITYLQSSNGFVYRELVKTSLMEGLLAYRLENLLHDSIYNTTLIANLQGNWDASFGYFDVPIGFPADTVGAKYWGRYAKNLSASLGLDTVIMNNFLIGRAAIDNGFLLAPNAVPANADYYAINDAATIINAFDVLVIGAAIHDLGQAKLNDSLGDPVLARAYLSSSWGFVHSLNYNVSPVKSNSVAQINSILAAYGTDLYKFNFAYQHVDSIQAAIGTGVFANTNF
ncbi:MAG TPA: DUF4856 domain-containing protein [Ferruginibacter sp.]|jgi:hypothetical protein|nr:DUF4856 domain-containing protein [Ferruginibacter sp.]